MRDNQKSRVYRAEAAIERYALGCTPAQYVKAIEDSEQWNFILGCIPQKTIQVSDTRADSNYSYANPYRWTLRFGQSYWHRSINVVLHEMAHLIVHARWSGLGSHVDKVADHGPEFCGVLVYLFEQYISLNASLKLWLTYAEHGVRVKLFNPQKMNEPNDLSKIPS